jgi:hypothetical protein
VCSYSSFRARSVFQHVGIGVAFTWGMPEDKRLVYVLKSATPKARYYIGLTADVAARLADHNGGRWLRLQQQRANSAAPSTSATERSRPHSIGA